MIQFFEEDNIEEILAVEECKDGIARTSRDAVSINNSDRYSDNDEDDIVLHWFESLWE